MKTFNKIYKFALTRLFNIVDIASMFCCGYWLGKGSWFGNGIVIVMMAIIVFSGISKFTTNKK